jgi:hypothetical protein
MTIRCVLTGTKIVLCLDTLKAIDAPKHRATIILIISFNINPHLPSHHRFYLVKFDSAIPDHFLIVHVD